MTASNYQPRQCDNETGNSCVSGPSSVAVECKQQVGVATTDSIETNNMSSVACAAPPINVFDDRKRPLSVASTSSSSSSSLPRRYRKKFAANVVTSGFLSHGRETHASMPSAASSVRHEDRSSSLSTVAESSPADWRLSPRDSEPSTHFRFAMPPHIAHARAQPVSVDNPRTATSLVSSDAVDKRTRDDPAAAAAASNDSSDLTAPSAIRSNDVIDVDSDSYVMHRVVEEIVETEKCYVHDLKDIVNVSNCCSVSF